MGAGVGEAAGFESHHSRRPCGHLVHRNFAARHHRLGPLAQGPRLGTAAGHLHDDAKLGAG